MDDRCSVDVRVTLGVCLAVDGRTIPDERGTKADSFFISMSNCAE